MVRYAVCLKHGCPELVVVGAGRCAKHKPKKRHFAVTRTTSSTQQGYGSRWRRARKEYLAANPHCVRCGNPSTTVDHIKPHRGDLELFWNRRNWQAMCKPCHDRKTASEVRRRGRGE